MKLVAVGAFLLFSWVTTSYTSKEQLIRECDKAQRENCLSGVAWLECKWLPLHMVFSVKTSVGCGRGSTQPSHIWRKVDSLDMRGKDKIQGWKEINTYPHIILHKRASYMWLWIGVQNAAAWRKKSQKRRWGKGDLINENIWFYDTY